MEPASKQTRIDPGTPSLRSCFQQLSRVVQDLLHELGLLANDGAGKCNRDRGLVHVETEEGGNVANGPTSFVALHRGSVLG